MNWRGTDPMYLVQGSLSFLNVGHICLKAESNALANVGERVLNECKIQDACSR